MSSWGDFWKQTSRKATNALKAAVSQGIGSLSGYSSISTLMPSESMSIDYSESLAESIKRRTPDKPSIIDPQNVEIAGKSKNVYDINNANQRISNLLIDLDATMPGLFNTNHTSETKTISVIKNKEVEKKEKEGTGTKTTKYYQEEVHTETFTIEVDNYISTSEENGKVEYKNLLNLDNTAVSLAQQFTGQNSGNQLTIKIYDNVSSQNESDRTRQSNPINIPLWGYDDFINERNIWIKGLSSPYGEPGYFYFKIFFDFNSLDGLLGGVLNVGNSINLGRNSAAKFLLRLATSGAYIGERMKDRFYALIKFVKLLSFINSKAPWFFSNISGLQEANNPILKDFSKSKTLTIKCNTDAIDMRLTTLLDLYKYACYDDILNREILPENLRKFDMSVLIFHIPIKKLHTSFSSPNERYKNGNGGYPYKKTYDDNPNNIMSYKLYNFQNCEIVPDSIGNIAPGSVKNDTPFQMGDGDIQISYDKCITYTSNEYNRIYFGSTGFLYDAYVDYEEYGKAKTDFTACGKDRLTEIFESYKKQRYENIFTKNPDESSIVELGERLAHNNLAKLSGLSLGNIYGQDLVQTGATTRGKYNSYFKWKQLNLAPLYKKMSAVRHGVVGKILNMLDVNMHASKYLTQDKFGNEIHSTGFLGDSAEAQIGSDYWNKKIQDLKYKTKLGSLYRDSYTNDEKNAAERQVEDSTKWVVRHKQDLTTRKKLGNLYGDSNNKQILNEKQNLGNLYSEENSEAESIVQKLKNIFS